MGHLLITCIYVVLNIYLTSSTVQIATVHYCCYDLFRKVFNHVKDFIHFNVSLSLLLSTIIFVIGNEAINEGSVRIFKFILVCIYSILYIGGLHYIGRSTSLHTSVSFLLDDL